MSDSFVHLHVHTEYSLLDGVGRIDKLVQKAKALGMHSLAITDHENMYGVIPFYQTCKKYGLNPIIGCEVSLSSHVNLSTQHHQKSHLLLLAENETGYRNLMQLTTIAQMKGKLEQQVLKHYTTGLIATSSCLHGEIPRAILEGRFQDGQKLIQTYLSLFGEGNFFLELQNPISHPQQRVNKQLILWSELYQVPLIATNNVHYINQEDEPLHRCVVCIKEGKKLDDSDEISLSMERELKSAGEMEQLFANVPEALANTVRIAERCQVTIPFGKQLLPLYPTPTSISAKKFLYQKCLAGVKVRYGEMSKEIEERLNYELSVIDQMGYNDYFLVVWDVVCFARSKQIAVGPGRGSAAGSLVAYLLKITDVDPLHHDLLFERFLNPERVNLPDIDLDFNDERRDEVIEYVRKKYGDDYMAQILTFGTMAPRAAIRDVGRVLGIPLVQVDQIANLIPRRPGMTLKKAFQLEPKLHQWAKKDSIKQLFQIVAKLEGLPRHVSTHAAGVVLSRSPLVKDVPLQLGNEDIPLTQYTMEHLESIGLCKIDLLGLRNLTVIERAHALLQQTTGEEVHYHQQDEHDQATYQLLAAGETIGVFQLESTGIRQVLQEVKPANFEDIVAVLSLYRPGPMEQIPRYIRAKFKQEPIELPHPDLMPILEKTYGIIIYQEQIMQIAEKIAGFRLGQADLLRRAIAKKQKKRLDDGRKLFVEGCVQNGYQAEVGHQIYDYIVHFADYGFNRSHAVAYSELAYQTAYLKANYPMVFMTALLSTVTDQTTKLAVYIKEAKRMGIQIKPPDIWQSEYDFSLEGEAIRFGFSAIKHASKAAVQEIIRVRKSGGPFRDLVDLCCRVNDKVCNRSTLEALLKSGALDSLPYHRNQKRAILQEIYEQKRSTIKNQTNLFDQADTNPWAKYKHLKDDSTPKKLSEEYEHLGIYLSGHPFDSYQRRILPFMTCQLDQLTEHSGQLVYVAGILQKIKSIRTKKGEQMAFITIEDQTAALEVVLFPKSYQRFEQQKLQVGDSVIIQGKRQQSETHKMIGQGIVRLQVVSILIDGSNEQESVLTRLKKVLLRHPGLIPVQLIYRRTRQGVALSIDKYGIQPSTKCLQQIEAVLGEGNIKMI